MNDIKRSEELFEALGELDDDLIAYAKHIGCCGENVIVLKKTPLWKTAAAWCAAAACLAVAAVVGIFGFKYINGKNEVTPPASGTTVGVSWAYPQVYIEEAKYTYTGDYSELEHVGYGIVDRVVYDNITALEESSDLIVIGEFTRDPRQFVDPNGGDGQRDDEYGGLSGNLFRADRVIKGDCEKGQSVLIFQDGFVLGNKFDGITNLTPMLKGDKWIYFLEEYGGGYKPLGGSDGRYPVPGSEHEFVMTDNLYGVFHKSEFRSDIYEEIKRRLPDWKYEEYFESEYPDDAEIFDGDFSRHDFTWIDCSSYKVLKSYEEIVDEGSDFIVTGEFIDDPRQQVYRNETDDTYQGYSYNKFRVDKAYKGDIEAGQVIIIRQPGVAVGRVYYAADNLTPMIKGDKWLYCLTKSSGILEPYRGANGRYPIPASGNTRLTQGIDCYGVCDDRYANREVCERLLKELGIAVTKDFDGVVLSVMTDDENLKVTACVRNTTDNYIALLMPVTGEGSHTEIFTEIKRGDNALIDIDTYDKAFNDALDKRIIEPGGEYVQEMSFTVPLRDSVSGGYERGEYRGTARIQLLSDPYDETSEFTERYVEFTVNVGELAVGAVTREYEHGDVEALWTMPEFPDVQFRCEAAAVFAERTAGIPEEPMVYGLYGGSPILDVYLIDLNGDGKRELVSAVCYGDHTLVTHIRAYDFANGIGYTLSGEYNYTLYINGGALIVRSSVPDEGVVSERPLTLEIMTVDNNFVAEG